MEAAATMSVRLSPKGRSILTNDPRRLPGVDMNSPSGRRYRDIVEALIVEFGSSDIERIRELGGLRYSREQVQALVVEGDRRAVDDLIRVTNAISRKENELRQRVAAAPIDRRPLHEKLMHPQPSGGRATEANGVAGRGAAAARIERIRQPGAQAGARPGRHADDDGGDG